MFVQYFNEDRELWQKNSLKLTDILSGQRFDIQVLENGVFAQKTITLVENILIWSQQITIDLNNVYMERICDNTKNYSGVQLNCGSNSIQLYSIPESLENSIKRYTIQTNYTSRYKTISKIGSGNTSKVYKIKSRFQGDYYAAKVMSKSSLNKETQELELKILRKINHKHIMNLQETYETADNLILIFDYCQGGDLLNYLDENPIIDEQRAKLIIKQILEGLSYLHSLNILHRDIKPDNIFLKKGIDHICIGDFGLADYWNVQGVYKLTRCGTPGYAAPEVLRDRLYDSKVDVFSVGIILYIMLTGRQPFESNDYETTLMNNYNGYIPIEDQKISNESKEYLRQLLDLNPKSRLTSQAALLNEYLGYKQRKMTINIQKGPRLDFKESKFERLPSVRIKTSGSGNGSPMSCKTLFESSRISPQSPKSSDNEILKIPLRTKRSLFYDQNK